jgi:hypothetical protein
VRHDRAVSADLQRDPAVLRSTARAIERLLPALRVTGLDPADLSALAGLPGGAALVAEHDRLTTGVGHARRELTDLVAALGTVAVGTEVADGSAVRAVRAVSR